MATGRTPRAAWYNQKHNIESDPLTLGKPKKVYFLFANSCCVVHTLHKSELDDITNHKPPHPMQPLLTSIEDEVSRHGFAASLILAAVARGLDRGNLALPQNPRNPESAAWAAILSGGIAKAIADADRIREALERTRA